MFQPYDLEGVSAHLSQLAGIQRKAWWLPQASDGFYYNTVHMSGLNQIYKMFNMTMSRSQDRRHVMISPGLLSELNCAMCKFLQEGAQSDHRSLTLRELSVHRQNVFIYFKCKRTSRASSSSVPSQCEDVLLVQWELHVSVRRHRDRNEHEASDETEQKKQETQTSLIEKEWKL